MIPNSRATKFRFLRLFLLILLAAAAIGPRNVSAQGPYSVAIIVADDFSGTDPTAAGASAGDNCAVSLESQAFVVRGVSAEALDVPHGELVLEQIESLLDEVGASDSIPVIPVDIQGATTDVVAERIETAMLNGGADFYVINMSFAVIPCEYLQSFVDFQAEMAAAKRSNNANGHRGLFRRAVLFYDDTVFPVMSQRAQTATDLDPLQTLLDAYSATAIPVASAGNFGLNFPFWPGAWGQVISASASTGQGFHSGSAWDKRRDTPLLDGEVEQPGRKGRVSNYAEIMLPGEYDSSVGMVSGTSFAAPRLSVALALYLSQVGSDFCRNENGYPALAYGGWDNLTLAEAVSKHCPAMEPYLP